MAQSSLSLFSGLLDAYGRAGKLGQTGAVAMKETPPLAPPLATIAPISTRAGAPPTPLGLGNRSQNGVLTSPPARLLMATKALR